MTKVPRNPRPQVVSPRNHLEVLADTLWAERHVVEYLLYKLLTARLMLGADERRFVSVALDEVDRVVGMLREAEQRREAALARVAAAMGVPESTLTMAELAARAPAPLRSVFRDHRDAFASMAAEIDEHSRANRRLAGAALGDVRRTLGGLTGPPVGTTYTADGRADTGMMNPVRLDQVL